MLTVIAVAILSVEMEKVGIMTIVQPILIRSGLHLRTAAMTLIFLVSISGVIIGKQH